MDFTDPALASAVMVYEDGQHELDAAAIRRAHHAGAIVAWPAPDQLGMQGGVLMRAVFPSQTVAYFMVDELFEPTGSMEIVPSHLVPPLVPRV